MAAKPQPAKKSYFFGKGYRDLYNTIKGAWARNGESIGKYRANLQDASTMGKAERLFVRVSNFLAIIAVAVCGSAITAVISAVNVVILLTVMSVIYVGFTVVWLIDRLYLVRNRIFAACPECKEKSLIPTYICPGCGEKHTNLTPGVYGILRRRCNCGYKLPTTFFNGRRNLEAECPVCGHKLMDRETRPICIPIVGGRSVGKTAFITAFSREFIENVAPEKGFEIEFYSDEKAHIYREITQDYIAGSTRMTDRPQDIHAASSVSFSFFVKSPAFSPERLVHVYDIAGEVFTDNSENEVQKQYEYCQGIVLIIDPFAIPAIRFKYEEQLAPEDVAGIGKADINMVIDSFMNKLREVTGLSDHKMAAVPLAVVISKIDSADLEQEVGAAAVQRLMEAEPERFTDFYDTQDYLCRRLLKDNGMESVLNSICIRFRTNRFFACSAIGHTRDKGAYAPTGVLPPMEWLFRHADSRMGQIWHDNDFSKKPPVLSEEDERDEKA